MIRVAFFDSKDYDRQNFQSNEIEIEFFETKLRMQTAYLAEGFDCVCAFVNDTIDEETFSVLSKKKIKLVALRCAGFNQVDLEASKKYKIPVVRVPAYSPEAVAEHAMAMLLTLDRKIHKAYIRTRDFNFSLSGLEGFVLNGKKIGIIGMGKIGQAFHRICEGFGMIPLCFDPYPMGGYRYVDLPTIFSECDIISLHCPLTEKTKYLINESSIRKMKKGVYLINTSRGGLIESEALLNGLVEGKIGGACLDVYEEESDVFYEDNSQYGMKDEVLALILARPNVIVTSHQAYFTKEALAEISRVTIENITSYFQKGNLINQV